ncbi:hypothetical protein N7I24_004872 [Vibrio alginolyticus]|uniref:hypothetical protein n=2 Tax=unclassified Vibrio TaxID=2614977 RepID=UPI002964083E|nr:hypothetical protein [Vibrio sp. Vb2135]EJA7359173.1 hypothetical protein [Vibrio alginolyticus]MDG2594109.1 hypothetical protein [Vibrio parahaemolyticus]EJV5952279.1 hypothetical protein [Vibrio alginolyticus]MDW1761033.1 hypothetical protein [Vibrio sp. Vb2135]HCH6002159.1 hypothetical protein [Vibrio parahaemolyticus]
MTYTLPDEINLTTLPLITQLQLRRLMNGDTTPSNVSQRKYVRNKEGKHEEAFYFALAVSMFRLLEEFNQNIKEEILK